jgi:hypothetical protein
MKPSDIGCGFAHVRLNAATLRPETAKSTRFHHEATKDTKKRKVLLGAMRHHPSSRSLCPS